jgi:hypothetical protein
VSEHHFTQGIDQRLQLNTSSTHPARQGGTRDHESGAGKDFFLAVQPQMSGVLGEHHLVHGGPKYAT